MLYYRELIERQLAARQFALEMDLHKANTQAAFIGQVDKLLSSLAWDYVLTINQHFDVTFYVHTGKVSLTHQHSAIEQALSARFEIKAHLNGFWVESFRQPAGACYVCIGDAA